MGEAHGFVLMKDSLLYCKFSTFTWFPKTPIAHAEETWCDGNQVAANCAGMPKMKICEMATTVCPANMAGKWSWFVAKTLIHDPRHVPRDPRSTERRSPWKRFKESNHLIKKRQHEYALNFSLACRISSFLLIWIGCVMQKREQLWDSHDLFWTRIIAAYGGLPSWTGRYEGGSFYFEDKSQ